VYILHLALKRSAAAAAAAGGGGGGAILALPFILIHTFIRFVALSIF